MLRRDFEVLPMVRGKGRFLGMHAGVRVLQEEFGPTWWGEGEVKIYLDGDTTHATLVGTGTEDYVGTGWGLGLFAQRESGCHLCDREHECFGLYRFHDCDPVFFDDSVRVVIQQLGLVRIDHLEEVERRGIRLAHPDPNLPDYAPPRIRESGGSRIFERRDDWCACAYFYLDTPEGQHTSLPPLGERIEGLRGTDEGRERLD